MLEDPRITAVNTVLKACREAADLYSTAASIAGEAEITRQFQNWRQTRERFAEKLEASIRSINGLPTQPDPDKKNLRKLWLRVKTALAEKNHPALVEEVRSIESDLKQKTDDAFAENLPEAAATILKELKQDIDRTLATLGGG